MQCHPQTVPLPTTHPFPRLNETRFAIPAMHGEIRNGALTGEPEPGTMNRPTGIDKLASIQRALPVLNPLCLLFASQELVGCTASLKLHGP
jgi:hypothetical protein